MWKNYDVDMNFEDVYVSFGMNSANNNIKKSKEIEDLLQKSILNQPLDKMTVLPEVQRAKSKNSKKVVQELPEEVAQDVEILKMRSVFDAKRFYKKNDTKNISTSKIQVGKVLDSPADFYHSRLTKKMRKPTLVDELLADDQFRKEVKRRYVNIIDEKRATYRKEFKKLKNKYKRKTKGN